MDGADMIHQKTLKQGFILATLVSTVAGTFITSINLYDRLIEQRRQRKRDRGQNKKIQELEGRLNEAEEEKKQITEAGENGNHGKDRDEFRNSLQQSGNMVQHEYDRHFANLGPRFGQGDLVAQNQIQSQIILLQGSVIKLLEEALLTGKLPDTNRLYNTSEFAREGSIRALHDQYQRLLESAPPQRRPMGLMRKTSSTPSLRDHSKDSVWSHRRPPQKGITYDNGGALFCRCAEDVQHSDRPLEDFMVMRRSSTLCAACGVAAGTGGGADGSRAWRIEKEVVMRGGNSTRDDRRYSRSSDDGSETIVVRTYLLTKRFIFKCHREEVGYACYLCFRHRDRDTLCRSEERLVSHVTSKHSIAEYEGDRDIRELNRTLPYR